MILQSSEAQSYVRRLRYYHRRDPERVAALAEAITVDIESGSQDYLQGGLEPFTQWLSLFDDDARLSRVSKLTISLKDLSPAESDLHARVLADSDRADLR
jgi:hypothetical protein